MAIFVDFFKIIRGTPKSEWDLKFERFPEKNTGPRTKFKNLYRTVLKNTGLSVEKLRRWSPYLKCKFS